jgi:hypothetical protein
MNPFDKMELESLQRMLGEIEKQGKSMRAALDGGQEFYRPMLERQRQRYKEIKARVNKLQGSAQPEAAAPKFTPAEFHQMCDSHDWNYHMSDDSGSYRAGKTHEALLDSAVNHQPELAPILKAWQAHASGGPKPVAPQDPAA